MLFDSSSLESLRLIGVNRPLLLILVARGGVEFARALQKLTIEIAGPSGKGLSVRGLYVGTVCAAKGLDMSGLTAG